MKKMDVMKYGKAKGTFLVQKYLPNISPFVSIDLIKDAFEWKKCKDNYDEFSRIRPDALIGEVAPRLEGSDGMLSSVPKMIEEMKKQNPNSALLITRTKTKQIPRYLDDGGFVILFDLDNSVVVEFVGKGFDGRELTHGKVVHESYKIPWNSILYLKDKDSLIKDRNIIKHFVDEKNYNDSREDRIEFLIRRCNYDKDLLEREIPKRYIPIDDSIIRQVIDDVILVLYLAKKDLLLDNLKYFCVQGNIIDMKLEPWELSTLDRLV